MAWVPASVFFKALDPLIIPCFGRIDKQQCLDTLRTYGGDQGISVGYAVHHDVPNQVSSYAGLYRVQRLARNILDSPHIDSNGLT